MGRSRRDASSISRPKPSGLWPRSAAASSTFESPGKAPGEPASRPLGAGRIRELASRHGIEPASSLAQHFLIDPNLARAIVIDAGVTAADRVLEIGAGIGSLTLALAHTGAKILAIEFDRALIPALEEVTKRLENVSVVQADATQMDLASLVGRDRWVLCANLPYNVATPVVLRVLAEAPGVHRLVVMVQREAGERFVASPGGPGYGPTSLRVAFHTNAAVVRSVPPEVFWPRPAVESVVVRMERVASAPVSADQSPLWRVVDESFRERRKTMRNALRRLGMDGSFAEAVLDRCGVPPQARPEQLGLQDFSCLAEELAR